MNISTSMESSLNPAKHIKPEAGSDSADLNQPTGDVVGIAQHQEIVELTQQEVDETLKQIKKQYEDLLTKKFLAAHEAYLQDLKTLEVNKKAATDSLNQLFSLIAGGFSAGELRDKFRKALEENIETDLKKLSKERLDLEEIEGLMNQVGNLFDQIKDLPDRKRKNVENIKPQGIRRRLSGDQQFNRTKLLEEISWLEENMEQIEIIFNQISESLGNMLSYDAQVALWNNGGEELKSYLFEKLDPRFAQQEIAILNNLDGLLADSKKAPLASLPERSTIFEDISEAVTPVIGKTVKLDVVGKNILEASK